MFTEILSLVDFEQVVGQENAVLAYFSTNECSVCQVLKPKVEEMLDKYFPEIKQVYVNCAKVPDAAAQNRVLSVPAILVYFEGREFLRKSRSFSIEALKNEIKRPYRLMFS